MVLSVIFLPMLAQHAYDDTDCTQCTLVQMPITGLHDSLGRDLYVRTMIMAAFLWRLRVMGAFVAVLDRYALRCRLPSLAVVSTE